MSATGVIHVHCEQLNGAAAKGAARISVNTSDQQVRDPVGNIVFSGPLTVTLVNGEATVTVPATDDATLSPTGFEYTVVEQLVHVAKSDYRAATFPVAGGTTVHTADVASWEEVDADPSYGGSLNGALAQIEALRDITDADFALGLDTIADSRITNYLGGAGTLARNAVETLQSQVVAVISDSTWSDLTEPFMLAFQEYVAGSPNNTLEYAPWDFATDTGYDSFSTLQTGNGPAPPVISVYLGAKPGGSLAGFFNTAGRMADMVPVQPDILFINTCHNDKGGSLNDYLLRLDQLVDDVRALYPGVAFPVVISSQNPEFSPRTAPEIALHLLQTRHLRLHALERGWGYIPAAERFLARTDFGSGLVEGADGVHPTTGGMRLWADAILDFLRGSESVRTRDTGWRLIGNGTFGVLNNFKIACRRTGDVVQVITAQTGSGATGSGAEVVATLLPGFRPDDPASMTCLPAAMCIGSDTIPIVGASIFADSTGTVTVNAVNTGRHYSTLTFTTTEPWPVDLPGTAA